MNQSGKELLQLLQSVRKHSRREALAIMRGLAPEGQYALLIELRRQAIEANGQRRLPIGGQVVDRASRAPVEASGRGKKVPYTVLLPQSMIDALKSLSEDDGDPVSHHIRTAIKAYLSRRR